jgi:hypothetical protein
MLTDNGMNGVGQPRQITDGMPSRFAGDSRKCGNKRQARRNSYFMTFAIVVKAIRKNFSKEDRFLSKADMAMRHALRRRNFAAESS